MRAVYNPRRKYMPQVQDSAVCDSMCNIPCEQVNLVADIYPRMIRSTDQNATLTFVATNTGSQAINQPVILVSSLLGNILLSGSGLNPGETKTLSRPYSISNIPLPSNSLTNVSYVAYGMSIPGGYAPGERLSKIITSASDLHSSPTGGVSINSSGEIIDGGSGVSIITMSFTVTTGSPVTTINVPLSGILDTSQGVTIIRNPNNMFQIINYNLVLSSNGQTLNPGVRYVVVLEGFLIQSNPYCDNQSCMLTYSASSATGTNSNLNILLNRLDQPM